MKPTLLLRLMPVFCASLLSATADPVRLTVDVSQPGGPINPAMWGVFFEDINYGADGGLLAELVKNRSFEFTEPLMGWTKLAHDGGAGELTVSAERPLNANNPHYLRLRSEGAGGFGLGNTGFFGMGVRKGENYVFSVQIRSADPVASTLNFAVLGQDGQRLGGGAVKGAHTAWQRFERTFRIAATDPKARLSVWITGPGTLDLDMISLFPQRTWKNRPNGLRADVVQALADMKPGFVRFPGGCIVEGRQLSTRYQWKTTIGAPEERRLIINRWNDEFKHRPAPDYFQSFGLGFFEYFQMCEDIGAAPLPILNCGMACQFNSNELVPLDQLDPFIQDALDLIEFANGPAASTWGGQRAAMGHPKPFHLRLLGVGNEQWGPQYVERLARFTRVLKAKHPEIQLVASAGPRPDDELFHFLWPKLRELNADIVDEHCYATPDWFLDNSRRYDNYARQGPKVFMGEYAAQSVKVVSPENRNNFECALAEAAFMTGLERNADVVVMSSYAPLFAHEEGWQWRPNLIWFDNLSVYGTPNYYVQQLFSLNRGDARLPVTLTGAAEASNGQPRFYASAVRDERKGEVILKVVNATVQPVSAQLHLVGAGRIAEAGLATVLTSANLADENSIAQPRKVAPREEKLRGVAAEFGHVFPPASFTVLRLRARPGR